MDSRSRERTSPKSASDSHVFPVKALAYAKVRTYDRAGALDKASSSAVLVISDLESLGSFRLLWDMPLGFLSPILNSEKDSRQTLATTPV